MLSHVRDVARNFALGKITLEDLREGAHAERIDRKTADEILELIAEWEHRSSWSRNELRMRVRRLIPPDPPPSRRREGGSLYDAGLKGHRRTG